MSDLIKTNKAAIRKLIYVQDLTQKNLIVKMLEQNGITVISKSVSLSIIIGYPIREELYVLETDFRQAAKILQELEQLEDVSDGELERLALSYTAEDEETDHSLNKHFLQRHIRTCIFLLVILLTMGAFYQCFNPVIKWHDETLRWLVIQELNKTSKDNIRISDVSKITELYLDAEEIRNVKDLKYFSNLKALELHTPKVDNLSSIENLMHLEKLVLSGLDLKTLDSLNGLHLTEITLHDLPLISMDPSVWMEGLRKLRLQGLPLSSIQSIVGAETLSALELEDLNIDNLEVLKDLPYLSSLSVKSVKTEQPIVLNKMGAYQNIFLSDLEVEGNISSRYLDTLSLENIDMGDRTDWLRADSLKHLTLKNCQIKDLTVLHDFTGLESLNMAGNKLRDIKDLENLTQLKVLSLEDNPVLDLSPIRSLKFVEKLDLSGIDFNGQEEFISDMKLRELRLSDCNITEIGFLQKQTEINRLDISDNPVRDLTPLSEWTDPGSDSAKEGVELNISGIPVGIGNQDILKSINLKILHARDCGLTDIEFLSSCKNLQYLDISDNQLTDSDMVPMLHMPQLREVCAKGCSITEGYLLYGIKTDWMKEFAVQLSPGIYGCPVDWKNHYNEDEMFINTWFRMIVK